MVHPSSSTAFWAADLNSYSLHMLECMALPMGRGSVCQLLASLLYGLEPVMDASEDSNFLQDMLMGNTLHLLIKVYERLLQFQAQSPTPVQPGAEELLGEVNMIMEELQRSGVSGDVCELISLLFKPDIKALLYVHDCVALKDYGPLLPPLPDDSCGSDQDSVKVIRLIRNQELLGATIKRDGSTGGIVVARIMKGGAADLSGLIHVGDELREVNGITMEHRQPQEIPSILALYKETVTFKVIPGSEGEQAAPSPLIFVKALFDYSPLKDPSIPCKSVGLAFIKGDILQIVSQEDEVWWQARHINESDVQTGLIPSQQLQERRVILQRPETIFNSQQVQQQGAEQIDADYTAISGIHIAGTRRSFRQSMKAPKMWRRDATPIPTYQEVMSYKREAEDLQYLVLLVGPSGVGRSDLKKKLLLSDPDLFSVPIPHTTREQRKQEKEGVEYNFVSRREFEENILSHKFIEYGEHMGQYYGTSVDSVQKVLAQGRVCLLDAGPHVIQRLYTTEFKPFVVFIKPPPIERLLLSRRSTRVITQDGTPTLLDAYFEDMISSATAMEQEYGHLFDLIVVNEDICLTFSELRNELKKLQRGTRWIPAEWTRM
ncbi:MAGUK p55 subfamily member 7-like isoform X2 [Denticeps clupeoides]|uniref:MAGUK p55 subfamily member 7-like isoform X2 n=1 Tax=Denticeps clupeoides TaxID=299321 RepID=UPI0010A40F3C|nr:MAGUK p55 subfamily member 7-like isoform X2 [Denticeps clupeoides]